MSYITFEQFVINHPELQDEPLSVQKHAYSVYLEQLDELYTEPY